MHVRFEAECDIPDGVTDIVEYLQHELLIICDTSTIKYPQVLSAFRNDPEPRKDIVSGEICPVCGFNGDSKIISLTDEYVELHCPQCKSNFKVMFSQPDLE